MHIGVFIFPSDQTLQPIPLARAVEERAFESLWFPEHSHIPVSRATPWGGREGAPPLPDWYWRTHDQFVALAACAAVTSTLKLGSGITLVAQRDPLWLAKEVASLDVISGGRFLFGIGYGWNKEEMANHGVAYGDRRAIVRENVLAMKALWTEEEAAFVGDHVGFEASWAWPKPVQRPHPPIILGADAGPKTARDLAEFCDGWMPLGGRHAIVDRLPVIQAAMREAGRDPASLEIGVFGAPADRGRLEELAEAGISRAVISLRPDPPEAVLARLDDVAPLVAALA